ncbi:MULTISPECIES: signal recognition particle protein [Breznakia]|uniref:Signal recognition particle protein n=1 Tax=Breznakia blatticola TaxID=1754012 RepID=A0A4R7ZCB7_9FIRM|nr:MULTISPECIES: signal recognition particle protein [Breznakia]MDH6366378.1 signal recognition particle subunit SRP54 [Breznakia sp. PH1-1]MDH6403471.1 signal recognition particle subunit SRP54 [Breznakia sp. PF1-11]MDH6411180.1 signal recognition particle subunit SRP54 [Breznakia sp. PFB1-11]MDH6413557.1 signal recognition particle subunit SRP54 [Breznakia sp. PFB1-14]MDH6415725.1 signal recognition particle subunit SRP54 [Breznakia sp. PFB1-4]
MFDSLTKRLNRAFKNISGKGKLTEKNMDEMLKEVRMSLLEADVNYRVVKDFIETIKEQALGQKVYDALDPAQMVLKIVRDELTNLLGSTTAEINYKEDGITTIMMVGLQGTGKTTASAKIANLMSKKQDRKVLLAACDVIRPAAIEQLQTLGKQIDVEVYTEGVQVDALTTAKNALAYAKANGYDTVLFDTAGRLHVDEELMKELEKIKKAVKPSDILLTVDAMTGQDIVNVAESFNEKLDVTGLVLTKLDGDARGGGILSVRAITHVPVKFVGTGEKIEDLDVFHPDRMAERILGMGDLLTLLEQAEEKMDLDAAEESSRRMMEGKFDLNDMLVQLEQINKMGSLSKIMKLVPGMGQMMESIDDMKADDQMKHTKAMIQSMTKFERENPDQIRSSRKRRIANGSGHSVGDVNKLLTQFEKSKKMMTMMARMSQQGQAPDMAAMQNMAQGGMPAMNQMPGKKKFVSKLKKRR